MNRFFIKFLKLTQTFHIRPIVRFFIFEDYWRKFPLSRDFGFSRGQPIDRYFIEKFLKSNCNSITGNVMEIADNAYTCRFGQNVTQSDILHVEKTDKATIIGNLETGTGIPSNKFDCIILTQTLPFIYDFKAVVKNSYTALKPGGTLLVTLPGISQISRYDMDRWGDFWRFTTLSAQGIFKEVFRETNIEVNSYGNCKLAISFLNGLAVEDMRKPLFHQHDPDYQLIITVKAVKNENSRAL